MCCYYQRMNWIRKGNKKKTFIENNYTTVERNIFYLLFPTFSFFFFFVTYTYNWQIHSLKLFSFFLLFSYIYIYIFPYIYYIRKLLLKEVADLISTYAVGLPHFCEDVFRSNLARQFFRYSLGGMANLTSQWALVWPGWWQNEHFILFFFLLLLFLVVAFQAALVDPPPSLGFIGIRAYFWSPFSKTSMLFRSITSRAPVSITLSPVPSFRPRSRLMTFSNSFSLCVYSTCSWDPSFCFEMINLARASIACDNLTISSPDLFGVFDISYSHPQFLGFPSHTLTTARLH